MERKNNKKKHLEMNSAVVHKFNDFKKQQQQ